MRLIRVRAQRMVLILATPLCRVRRCKLGEELSRRWALVVLIQTEECNCSPSGLGDA